jgi:hypothetical protein
MQRCVSMRSPPWFGTLPCPLHGSSRPERNRELKKVATFRRAKRHFYFIGCGTFTSTDD